MPRNNQKLANNITQKSHTPVVFGMLFNEQVEYLSSCIQNFLLHVKEGILFINLPITTLDEYKKNNKRTEPLKTKDRIQFVVAHEPRQHWGATLMLGHLYTYTQAKLQFEFDYYCTLASNSLFVKAFDLNKTILILDKAPSHLVEAAPYPDPEWIDQRACFPAFRNLLSPDVAGLYGNEIEGFFTSAENWEIMLKYVHRLEHLESSYTNSDGSMRLAVEEFFPAMIVCGLGDRKYINIHRRLFSSNSYTPQIKSYTTFQDLMTSDHPPEVCGFKWFHRSPSFPITAAVTNPAMNKIWKSLESDVNNLSQAELLIFSTILVSAQQEIERKLSLDKNIRIDLMSDWSGNLWHLNLSENCNGQVKNIFIDEKYETFLFYNSIEEIQTNIELLIRKSDYGTFLSIKCEVQKLATKNTGQLPLAAFWYLPFPRVTEGKKIQIKLEVKKFDGSPVNQDEIFKYCALCVGGGFMLAQAVSWYKNEYIFIFDPTENTSTTPATPSFVGVPVHVASSTDLIITFSQI